MEGREKDILDILYEKERVGVAELAKSLYVSEMTVRRDLAALEKRGLIKRYRGGAVLSASSAEMPISNRFFVDENEKKELGRRAADFLRDEITLYIDSSSTCQYVIPHISGFKGITLVTNSVNALLLASKLGISCILLGGSYYGRDMCLVGPIAQRDAEVLNVDLAFFSTLGISEDGVISDNDIEQTAVRRAVMERAARNVFLYEKSKLGKKFLYTLCEKDEADVVITIDKDK